MKYWTFISYSHTDEAWARWLQRGIETYRVPRGIAGGQSGGGKMPARLFPVFRDRDELPTSSNLSQNIRDALENSRYLTVICSPRAAGSRWVNEEIKTFKALGRSDRILCLIVEGEPNASDNAAIQDSECFPAAVRFQITPQGELGSEREEPIAADARPGKDGKDRSRFKIIAGLLGVGFDALWQREKRRRRVHRALLAAASILLIGGIWGIWYSGNVQAKRLDQQRNVRLAELMLQKTREALSRGDDPRAMFYGANVIRYSVLGGVAPLNQDLLSSLALSAVRGNPIDAGRFAGALAGSADQSHVLWRRSDGAMALFDNASDRVVASWRPARPALAAALSPDGSVSATGDAGGDVEIRDGGEAATLHIPGGEITALVFGPKNGLLAAGSDDGGIHVMDSAAHRIVLEIKGNAARVNGLAFSPDGETIASVTDDRKLTLWRVKDGKPLKSFTFEKTTRSVGFSPDGDTLAVGIFDASVRLWSVGQWKEIGTLLGHSGMVEALCFSSDGQLLATAGDDGNLGLWDVSARGRIAMYAMGKQPVTGVAFLGHDRRLAAGSQGQLASWMVAPPQYYASFHANDDSVRRVVFSPDGHDLVSAGEDASIRIWDVATGKAAGMLPALHKQAIRGLAFNREGTQLVSAGMDHLIALWDYRGRKLVKSVAGHPAWIFDVAVSPRDGTIATAGYDNKVKLWSPELAPLATLSGHDLPVGGVAFAPDGALLASAGNDKTIRLWNAQTYANEAVLRGNKELERPLVFAPDGKMLASGGGDGLIKLWDVTGGQAGARLEANLTGHYAYMVWALAISPDGTLLASASQSDDRQTIRLWDLKHRTLLARLAGHRIYALSLAFSPDGAILASGGSDGTIRLWRIQDLLAASKKPDMSGTLLAAYLSHPPFTPENAAQLVAGIGKTTGLVLAGTDAVADSAGDAR